MPIRIICTGCGKALNVPDQAAGKRVRCPACQAIVAVEDLAVVTAEEPAETLPPAPRRQRKKAVRAARPGFFARLFGKSGWSAEERDWMRRIALDADNVDLRLDFADWLDQRGHALGELIWLEHEMEGLKEGDERYQELNVRLNELLDEHAAGWFKALGKLGLKPELAGTFFPYQWMHNGLIDEVLIDRAGILPEKANHLFAAAPALTRLEFNSTRAVPTRNNMEFEDWEADIPAIVALPQMEQIRSLDVTSLRIGSADMEALTTSPNLRNLTELKVSGDRIGAEGARLLAASTTLTRLRLLSMSSCALGPEGARALAGAKNLGKLTTLELGYNHLGPEGAAALAPAPLLAHLHTLEIQSNEIGPEGAATLGRSPYLHQLTVFNVESNAITTAGLRALLALSCMPGMKVLKIGSNELDAEAGAALAAARLGHLEELELGVNELGAEGVQALAGANTFRRLEKLRLSFVRMGDAGIRALVASPLLNNVNDLVLLGNEIGPAGVQALAASPRLGGLKTLILGSNPFGLAGARALARSPYLTSLEYLDVSDSELDEDAQDVLRQRFGDVVHF